MSSGLLDFFVLEGSDCVEQLDGLLARAGHGAPDPEAFLRNARALRGSATMVKIQGIADVAGALERIFKGLRDGTMAWTPQLRGVVVAAIDDLKMLIRGVRTWGDAENARANTRWKELVALAPAPLRTPPAPVAAAGSASFLAVQAADIAAGLHKFADSPGPQATFSDTLARIRALRGVAALLDLPPLAEVIAAVDEAAKGLELGTTTATDALRDLFRTGAAVLRESAEQLRAGQRPNPTTPAVFTFTDAAQVFVAGASDDDQVVPIQMLFPDGADDSVVHAEPHPPTTPSQRFKLEVVSQAEHLRRLVGDARRAVDAPTYQRLGHELRSAVRTLARSAASFGELVLANSLNAMIEGASSLDPVTLTGLDEAAVVLASRADEPLGPQIAAISARTTPVRSATPVSATPVVPPPRTSTPPLRAASPPRSQTPVRAQTPVRGVTPVRGTTPMRGTTAIRSPLAERPVTPVYAPPLVAAPRVSGERTSGERTSGDRGERVSADRMAAAERVSVERTPAPQPLAAERLTVAPSGAALHQMLGAGLSGLSGLNHTPLVEPADLDDDSLVPIQDLLYRGRAALRRAAQLGQSFRHGASTPSAEELTELLDLLELAEAD